ncbi:asparagine synthase-related protein [Amycolatopsis minnesotensis]|uniref:Lasso peptide isopeptide bond-forming cyclase n=1 Tax=Amycolatopsis minnesotensis TaxID=337894 RepID=A0ABN2R4L6_9PSEU
MSLIERWLVLPDLPQAQSLAEAAAPGAPGVVPYPSGRPWLLGQWAAGDLTMAAVGPVRVVVIGNCPVTTARLRELVAGVRRTSDLDAVVRALPGSHHVVAAVGDELRVQGSLTGVRRVFHAVLDGVTLAGDRADVLAGVVGGGLDEQALAMRVVCGGQLPPPLGEHPTWHGVRALDPDHYLRVDARSGAGRTVRWWAPPVPETPLAAGAEAVGHALRTAVAGRGPGEDGETARRVSADLSGGMDSTSLCFLAARAGIPRFLTIRWGEAEAANDDTAFAACAVTALAEAEHVVLPQQDLPPVFADPGHTGDVEAPYLFTRTHARVRHTARELARRGVGVHLAGHGGDELFHGPFHYVRDLLRHRPGTGLAHLRGHRALHNWPFAATVAALADFRDLRRWWRDQATHLTGPPPARYTPNLGWGHPLRAPDWATPAALEAAREMLHATADRVHPLAAERGQHSTLSALRTMGSTYRQLARLFAGAGVRLEMPYLDDRVVEAALSVRLHDRRTPWRYKPLLAEAVRDTVPSIITGRITKGDFGEDVRAGLRRGMPDLLELFADSALARRGLIDPDILRARLLAPRIDNTTTFALENLLGCETHLRGSTAPLHLSTGGPNEPTAAP